MTGCSRFAYAQARVQARFALLPVEAEWQRLAAARTLAVFLEEARAGALHDWVKGFSSQSDTHDLEVGVRNLFRETVEQVAGWVPKPWKSAVLWVGWLPLLPLLDHLARVGRLPGWVARDPFLRGLLGEIGGLDRGRLRCAGAGPLSSLPADPAAVWTAEWRRRRPSCGRAHRPRIDDLAHLLGAHGKAFHTARAEVAWEMRRALRSRLSHLLHLQVLQPTAPFLFLTLTALDLERLRAELVSRALFAGEEATA